jgi:hypothetical protein
MAQFRASVQGQRGGASRLGGKSSGIHAKINGWGLGVDVDGAYDKKTDCDSFTVTITSGSGHGKGALLIKEDRDANGLLMGFTVSEKPAEACGA